MQTYIFYFPDCVSWGECLKNLNINPDDFNLAIFFVPYSLINKDFDSTVRKFLGNTDYLAVSTRGGIYNSKTLLNGVSGIFIKYERKGKHTVNYCVNVPEYFERSVKNMERFLNKKKENTNIIFTTLMNTQINQMLDLINIKTDTSFSLVGGVASSFDENFKTKIVFNGIEIEDGYVILSFENIKSSSSISLGFIPVGPGYLITKANLNKIYELDGIHIKHLLDKLLQGTGIYTEQLDMIKTSKYLWNFPFQIVDKKTGFAYICRTPKMYNTEEDVLEFWGNFKENDVVKISIGDPDDLIDDIDINMKLIKINLYEKDIHPEFAFVFSCVARNELFQKINEVDIESKQYKKHFPNIDIVGMLTYGEIGMGKRGKKVTFYNQTSIFLALWEEDV